MAEVQVLGDAKDSDSTFTIVAPGKTRRLPEAMIIPRDAVWAKPDRSRIAIQISRRSLNDQTSRRPPQSDQTRGRVPLPFWSRILDRDRLTGPPFSGTWICTDTSRTTSPIRWSKLA